MDPSVLQAIEEGRMSASWLEFERAPRGVFIDDETAPGVALPPSTSENPNTPYEDAPFFELILRDGTREMGRPMKRGNQTGWLSTGEEARLLRQYSVIAWRKVADTEIDG